MKTLNEVIDIMEHPMYGADEGFVEIAEDDIADALHYLKAHKNQQDFYDDGIKRTTEMIDKCEKTVAEYLAVNNPPLTFEEVCEMVGMPVWMELNYVKGWRLVNCFDSTVSDEKVVALTDRFGVDFVFSAETLAKCEVKVYRREKK